MYVNSVEAKFFRCWLITSTIGLVAGLIAGFTSSIFIYEQFSYLRIIVPFLGGAIAGLSLGFCQSLALPKLLREKPSSTNIRKIKIKWIYATTIGLSIGAGITSIWSNFNPQSPVKLALNLLCILIVVSLTQGLIMKWSRNSIYKWILVKIVSALASALVGVFLYFVSAFIAVGLTGGGLAALGLAILIASLLISLSTGLIYGGITGLYLPDIFSRNRV